MAHTKRVDLQTGEISGYTIAAEPSRRRGRVADIAIGCHDAPKWSATCVLVVRDGRDVLDDLRFVTPVPSGITSDMLRAFPMRLVLDEAREQLRSLARVWDTGLVTIDPTDKVQAAFIRRSRRAAKALDGGPRRGRIGYGVEHYRAIAVEYLDVQHEQGSRGIREVLAERHGVSPETMRDWIRRARELGFLSKAIHGRGGATAGPRLTEEAPPSTSKKDPR